MTDFLTAAEAAKHLGVSRQTLYAYVSRGLLRAHDGPDPRQRRYDAKAVARLGLARKRGRRPKDVAKAALDWGTPVLESAITLIRDGQLYYRGHDAIVLAQTMNLESAAALLWRLPQAAAFPPDPPPMPPALIALSPHYTAGPRDEALLPLFAAATEDDPTASWQTDPERLARGCGHLARIMAGVVADIAPMARPIHQQLAAAWRLNQSGADLVRMALVLCADHELNASGFTARCVASTGASARAAVIGGLAALSGGLHGGMTARVERFCRGMEHDEIAPNLRRLLAAGDLVPGFGHPLYPDGDVRAAALLARILPRFPRAHDLVRTVETLTGLRPNIDFALVVLRRFLHLPEGAAFGLFALGRIVGWIAHALEQRENGGLIRPRAVYTGVMPD